MDAFRLPLALVCFVSLGACSNFDCEAVSRRILDDCELIFGTNQCSPLYDPAESAERSLVLSARICETRPPRGDEECYLTASCEELATGGCAPPREGEPPNPQCSQMCTMQLEVCVNACGDESNAATCDDCTVGCNEESVDCRTRC
jgi:hypothetical protein